MKILLSGCDEDELVLTERPKLFRDEEHLKHWMEANGCRYFVDYRQNTHKDIVACGIETYRVEEITFWEG